MCSWIEYNKVIHEMFTLGSYCAHTMCSCVPYLHIAKLQTAYGNNIKEFSTYAETRFFDCVLVIFDDFVHICSLKLLSDSFFLS